MSENDFLVEHYFKPDFADELLIPYWQCKHCPKAVAEPARDLRFCMYMDGDEKGLMEAWQWTKDTMKAHLKDDHGILEQS